jgi:hypothetical protein
VAREQGQWAQSRGYHLKAFLIFFEYHDIYSASIVFRALARLWKESDDKNLPLVFASLTAGMTVEEAEIAFRQVLGLE